MEDTQAINWEVEEEEETERPSESLGCILEPLGRLHIFSSAHGPEKDFPLYLGKNVVGRMPDCSVTLPFPSISKQHAVIEILAWDKAPILRDCGSLNGTQILSPPKVLSPGLSHRLRDQELIVFADLPCQYHRLDVPLSFVSRGCLTVEETPRVQGGTQPQGLLLAEDSEEEVDLSKRFVVKEPRTTSSPMATVVPESDDEGASPAPDGPGPPLAFNLDSDTDEEESQQPAVGEASSAARNDAIVKTEQSKAAVTEIQLKKHQCSVKEGDSEMILERTQPAGEDSETDVEDEGRPPGRLAEVLLERAQPFSVIDSDTDIEEEGLPVTPAVVPVKKRQAFHGVSARSPGGPGSAVGDGDAPQMAPLERSHASMVIDSNAGDEEEVAAALTLTCLKENQATMWDRSTNMEEGRAQPVALLEQSRTSVVRDSDTDVEEEVEMRDSVPKSHMEKAHSEKSQPLFRDSDIEMEEDRNSPGVHLERSQACATGSVNTQGEEDVPAQPAVILMEKQQMPMALTIQTNVEAEGGPAKPHGTHIEEAGPPPGTPGEPTQPQRKGAQPHPESGRETQADMTRDSGGNHDGSEDLDLQATQCFVERDNQSLEVQSMEDEPTQAFPTQEPSPSYSSSQDPGARDEPWQILPTQPFCPGESETSETQSIAAHLDAHGFCSSPSRAMPRDQHPESPVHAEPLRIQGGWVQTVEKGMGTPRETVERVTPKRGPLERETKKLPPEGEREDVVGEEELTRVMQDREQKQVLARATQRRESAKIVKSTSTEKHMQNLKAELEAPKELPEREVVEQTLAEEIFETEAEKLAPEREYKPGGLQVTVPKMILEGDTWNGETETGSQDQRGQACSPTPEPEVVARDFQGLASALIASGSQSGAEQGAPLSPRRQQRGHSNCKMPPAEKPSGGHLESQDASLPPTVPEASAPFQNPLMSQSQEHPAPQPHLCPSPPLQPHSPRTRQKRTQKAPETPLSSELDLLHVKPRGRPQGSSRITPTPVSSIALNLHPTTCTDQPITPKPTTRTTWGRKHRSSVKTPEPIVPTAHELQPSIPIDQTITPKPTSRVTRGRSHRSSVKSPEPIIPIVSELQPSTPTDQPITHKPTSRVTRGRSHRSSVKSPEPIIPVVSELQPSTPTDQPVTPKPVSRATRGRIHRSSVKTPEPIVPLAPELQHSTSTDQSVTPKPTSWATQGRIHRSVKMPETFVPTAPEFQHSTSIDQLVTPKPTLQATRGKKHRSSVRTRQPIESTAPDLEPPTPTEQPVTPKAIAQGCQSRTLRSTSSMPVPTILKFQSPIPTDQPVSPEPVPQANCSRRPRATRKHGFLTAHTAHEPCSVPPEPDSPSSRNKRQGAVRAAESLSTIPEPAFVQPPEAGTHASQIQKVEAAGRHRFTPEPQPKASQNRKRPSGTVNSPPLQKQLKRGEVLQKTAFLKEENVGIPGPGKRKRGQAEEGTKGTPAFSPRRTKPNHKATAPKVLFTGVADARGERAVLALGGHLASSVAEASCLVTDRIRRTVKFLCALGRGIPILSLDWLYQSHRAGCFLPTDEYVVADPEQEKNFGFSLRDALNRAREQRLLEGYEIHVTPGVQPPPAQMGEIISCCGGTVLPSMPRSYKPRRVVITCSEDFPRCSTPLRVGLPILSPEFLLTGVLKQEAKPEDFIFSTVEMPST